MSMKLRCGKCYQARRFHLSNGLGGYLGSPWYIECMQHREVQSCEHYWVNRNGENQAGVMGCLRGIFLVGREREPC